MQPIFGKVKPTELSLSLLYLYIQSLFEVWISFKTIAENLSIGYGGSFAVARFIEQEYEPGFDCCDWELEPQNRK